MQEPESIGCVRAATLAWSRIADLLTVQRTKRVQISRMDGSAARKKSAWDRRSIRRRSRRRSADSLPPAALRITSAHSSRGNLLCLKSRLWLYFDLKAYQSVKR
jgi:hypothetical protein